MSRKSKEGRSQRTITVFLVLLLSGEFDLRYVNRIYIQQELLDFGASFLELQTAKNEAFQG